MGFNSNSKYFPPGDERLKNSRTVLPEVIKSRCQVDLGFNDLHGGRFNCPCCGSKLGLYFKNGQYNIQDFENCGHFGYCGIYPNDAVGIILASKGENWTHQDLLDAYSEACGTVGAVYNMNIDNYSKKKREQLTKLSEELSEESKDNLITIRDNTLWGTSNEIQRLLAFRGINMNTLSPFILSQVGYINCRIKKLKSPTQYYTWQGLVFALGEPREVNVKAGGRSITERVNPGFQVRCTHLTEKGLMFVTKEMEKEVNKRWLRFYNQGFAHSFNISALNEIKELPIFVTEGPIDALSVLTLAQRNEHQRPINAIGLQGVRNSVFFVDAIRKKKKENPSFNNVIFLAFDQDKAGRQAIESMTDELKDLGVTTITLPLPSGIKDINELLTTDPYRGSAIIAIAEYVGTAVKRNKLSESDAKNYIYSMNVDGPLQELAELRDKMLAINSKNQQVNDKENIIGVIK